LLPPHMCTLSSPLPLLMPSILTPLLTHATAN
jgi:hypothetical protein